MPKILTTPIKDLLIIDLEIYRDDRGFFIERFNQKTFTALGLNANYCQDNFSRSLPKVIRGMHYQNNPSQAKLIGCINGKIWDVAVDLRKNSATYGQHFGVELSGDSGKLLYIPAGFAHGFCVLGDQMADVFYKVDAFYSKEGEGGIAYNDKDLAIKWPIADPILSQRDKNLPSFKEFNANSK